MLAPVRALPHTAHMVHSIHIPGVMELQSDGRTRRLPVSCVVLCVLTVTLLCRITSPDVASRAFVKANPSAPVGVPQSQSVLPNSAAEAHLESPRWRSKYTQQPQASHAKVREKELDGRWTTAIVENMGPWDLRYTAILWLLPLTIALWCAAVKRLRRQDLPLPSCFSAAQPFERTCLWRPRNGSPTRAPASAYARGMWAQGRGCVVNAGHPQAPARGPLWSLRQRDDLQTSRAAQRPSIHKDVSVLRPLGGCAAAECDSRWPSPPAGLPAVHLGPPHVIAIANVTGESTERQLAVLIDAENTSPKVMQPLMMEVAKLGTPAVKRIYGDWTTPFMKSWSAVLLEHAISPIQQFMYTTGKNSSDAALIIDAMDLLHGTNVDGFCLVRLLLKALCEPFRTVFHHKPKCL